MPRNRGGSLAEYGCCQANGTSSWRCCCATSAAASNELEQSGLKRMRLQCCAHGPDAELIPCVMFSEEIDDIEHFPALALRIFQPDKRRHYVLLLPSALDINQTE